jgi:hypothetical protein
VLLQCMAVLWQCYGSVMVVLLLGKLNARGTAVGSHVDVRCAQACAQQRESQGQYVHASVHRVQNHKMYQMPNVRSNQVYLCQSWRIALFNVLPRQSKRVCTFQRLPQARNYGRGEHERVEDLIGSAGPLEEQDV